MKTKTIKFAYLNLTDTFKVVQVTDSTEFVPGQVFPKSKVDDLCVSNRWKVTIVAPANQIG